MSWETLITLLLLTGAGVFLYLYHLRTRQFDASERQQVTRWNFYEGIDWYLKLSTLAVTIAAIHLDHGLLLELHNDIALRSVGLVGAGVALALFAFAIRTLDANYTPAHQSHLPATIVQQGPYRYIRHPIYTSNVILMVSLGVASGSLLLLANLVILIAYYVPTILVEETALLKNFPEYREYASRTGRFVPRLSGAPVQKAKEPGDSQSV